MSEQKTMLIAGSDSYTETMLNVLHCHVRTAWFMNYQFIMDGRNAVSADALMYCKKWDAAFRVMSCPDGIIEALETGQIQRVVLLEMASECAFRLGRIEQTAKQHGVEVVTQFFG